MLLEPFAGTFVNHNPMIWLDLDKQFMLGLE